MKEMTMEQLKKVELDALLHFADFCDKHGLKYFLAYGTLIGAVRHKGFIPWDDDIDTQMPRPDYEKLIRIFNAENADTPYRLIEPGSKQAKHTFVKIIDTRTVKTEPGYDYENGALGVDLDVFPIDGTPENDAAYAAWYQKLKTTYRRYRFMKMRFDGGLVWRLKLFLHKFPGVFVGADGYFKKAEKLHAEYPYEQSRYVASIAADCNGIGNRSKKENFEGFTLVEFEGYTFKAPVGYDEVLSNLFGDYMQLPPEEKRVTHHTNKVYFKE